MIYNLLVPDFETRNTTLPQSKQTATAGNLRVLRIKKDFSVLEKPYFKPLFVHMDNHMLVSNRVT